MKQTTPFGKLLLSFVWMLLGFTAWSQTPTYEMYVTNQSQIDSKTYQFDVYLLRTGSTPLELASIQFGLGVDTMIVNGGTLSFSMVSGSSQLVTAQVPTAFAVGASSQTNTVNGVVYRYLNQAAKAGPGAGNGTVISAVKTSCASPGTRIGTYRLTNTVDFRQASSCKHIFNTGVAAGRTNTLVNAYIGTTNTAITNTANHLTYNSTGTCDQNLSLNGCAVVASITDNSGVTCFGGSNGSVTVSLSGTGTSSTGSYSVDGGTSVSYSSNPFTVSGLSAGSHSISITSGLCSASTGSFNISGPSSALSSSFSASGCDSYTLPWGTTVTSSGAYTHIYTSASGCDSTVTANITINASTSSSSSATACDSYVWSVNGQTYTASGTYSATSLNAAGCTHTDILNLTINASTSNSSSATACDSYVWSVNGQTYTASGTYSATSLNAAGCTHTDILNLTVNNSTSSSSSVTECNSYTLPWGTVVTTSGVYSNVYQTVAGCDSTVTVDVTINYSTNTTENVVICSNAAPYVWNGGSYSTSGTYTYDYTNSDGCSSTATLVLTVNSVSSSQVSRTICLNQLPYTWNGVIFTAAGTQSATLTNAAGCDSVVTMTLGVSGGTPAAVTAITQTLVTNNCGARVYRYVAPVIANASGYAWTLPTGVGGVAGVTVDSGDATFSRIILVRYASNLAAISTDSIKVRPYSGCGTAATKGFKLTNTAWAPLAAPVITATNLVTTVCDSRKVRYSVAVPATTAGAVGFEWSFEGTFAVLGTNATIDSGTSTSRVITVVFANNAASTATDNVVVRYNYNDGCSYGAPVKKAIGLVALPKPAAPTVTATTVVNNVCNGRKVRYSVPAYTLTTTAAATGYNWTFNGSGLHATLGTTYEIDSMDAGGLSASRVIVVRYISNAAQAASDNVTCAYTTACGNGATSAVKVPGLAAALAQPAAPAVTSAIKVSNVCSGRKVRYSVPLSIGGATSATSAKITGYNWTFNGSGLHATLGTTYEIDSMDAGGLSASRVIVVRYISNSAQATSDNVQCAYTTACGSSPNSAVKVPGLTAALAQPTAPAVTSAIKVSNECGGRRVRYSVPLSVGGATSATSAAITGYNWIFNGSGLHATLGTTYAIDSMDAGGLSASRVIVVRYLSNAAQVASDNVQCAYTTACGSSANSAVKVPGLTAALVTPVPAAPVITLVSDVCGARVYRYSTATLLSSGTATAPATTAYAWSFIGTLGSNAVLDSGSLDGRVVRMRFSSNAASAAGDSARVALVSGCGTGLNARTKLSNVAKTGCPPPTAKVSAPAGFGVSVYPNPSQGEFNVQLSGATSEAVSVRILDAQGRYIKSVRTAANQVITLGSDLKAGAYLLEVRQGNNVKVTRVLKF